MKLEGLIRLRDMVAPLLSNAYTTIQWENSTDTFALVAWSKDHKRYKAINPNGIEANEVNAQRIATKLEACLSRERSL